MWVVLPKDRVIGDACSLLNVALPAPKHHTYGEFLWEKQTSLPILRLAQPRTVLVDSPVTIFERSKAILINRHGQASPRYLPLWQDFSSFTCILLHYAHTLDHGVGLILRACNILGVINALPLDRERNANCSSDQGSNP